MLPPVARPTQTIDDGHQAAEGVGPRLADRRRLKIQDILQKGQADLVGVGREFLNNPNWGLDAAIKLGVEDPFTAAPPQTGWWLEQRAKRGMGCQASTFQPSLASEIGDLSQN